MIFLSNVIFNSSTSKCQCTENGKIYVGQITQISSNVCSNLHTSLLQGRTELCSLLINAGACVNLADSLGAAPLHRAAGPGHADVVRLLLAADNIKV